VRFLENCFVQNTDNNQVIIVGAGLGGLGAAIAILLAGHAVTVLESAAEIAEVNTHRFSFSILKRMLWQLHTKTS
jgi:cation diffusion facilitator CzcD-associated flavoprotein CzcO